MQHKIHQTFGSGALQSNPNEAFKMAKNAPVVIMARTVPKAVLVSPEMWNAMIDENARLIDELSKRYEISRELEAKVMGFEAKAEDDDLESRLYGR